MYGSIYNVMFNLCRKGIYLLGVNKYFLYDFKFNFYIGNFNNI